MQITKTFYVVEMNDTYHEQMDQAPDDEPIIIMRDGEVIAQLSPSFGPRLRTDEEVKAMIEEWDRVIEGSSLGGITIRELIDEGRRY